MIYLSCWLSVPALKSLVTNCRQVHVSSLLCDLNTLEFGIVEIVAIVDVFSFGWVEVILQLPEIRLAKFGGGLGSIPVLDGVVETLLMLIVDSSACHFGKTLCIQVLTCNLWDIAGITGNVLSLNILGGTANPVLAFKRRVSILQLIEGLFLCGWVNMVVSLLVRWLADGNVHVVL